MEGEVRAALLDPLPRDPLDPGMNSKSCIFRALVGKISKTSLSFDVFLTFLGQPRAKHILVRQFSAESLPRMLSKPIIPFGTSLKESKKRQAIASAGSEALGSCRLAEGSSGSSWEVVGELGKLRGSSQRYNT